MKLTSALAAIGASLLLNGAAMASDIVKVVVAYPPGASLDNLARLYGDQLRTVSGTTVVVENKAGANGQIGAQSVVQSDPDGKTLLFAPDTMVTVNPFLYKQSKFDVTNLVPVGMVALQSSVLVVKGDSKLTSLKELQDSAKSKDITYSSAGAGSSGHLVMSYYQKLSGIKATHIPYRGGASAALAVISGEVDSAFLAVGNVMSSIKQGKLKALAVTSPSRLEELTDVPTMAELGHKDFVLRNGNMVMVPKTTPSAVRTTLFNDLKKVSVTPKFKQSVTELGMEVSVMNEKETSAWLATERARWEKIIQSSGIKVE